MTGYKSTRLLLLRFFTLLLLLTVITSLVIYLLADAKRHSGHFQSTKARYVFTDLNFREKGIKKYVCISMVNFFTNVPVEVS